MQNKSVKLLLYCTKEKNKLDILLPDNHYGKKFYLYGCPYENFHYQKLNGKVVAEAECDLVEDLSKYEHAYKDDHFYGVLKNACLTTSDLEKYCPVKMGEYKSLYGIHLKNVKPFDAPKELTEYFNKKPLSYDDWLYGIYSGGKGAKGNYESYLNFFKITKAPQNMMYADYPTTYPMYVECNYIGTDVDWERYILISIRPEWLCKILNGEKTIEVRKSIVNALKELIANE